MGFEANAYIPMKKIQSEDPSYCLKIVVWRETESCRMYSRQRIAVGMPLFKEDAGSGAVVNQRLPKKYMNYSAAPHRYRCTLTNFYGASMFMVAGTA